MNSKEKLLRAARDLYEKQSFHMVSVEMLTEAAGVSRATFYRCFVDKYDLYLQTIYFRDASAPKMYDYKCTLEEHRQYCVWVAERMYAEAAYIRKAFQLNGPNSFKAVSHLWLYDLYRRRIIENTPRREPTGQEERMLILYCSGIMALTDRWINENCPCTPEELADTIFQCMPEAFRAYFPG